MTRISSSAEPHSGDPSVGQLATAHTDGGRTQEGASAGATDGALEGNTVGMRNSEWLMAMTFGVGMRRLESRAQKRGMGRIPILLLQALFRARAARRAKATRPPLGAKDARHLRLSVNRSL